MAFVKEYVTEEDKKRIDFASISSSPYGDPKTTPVSPFRWIIDRERDVFLMCTWFGHYEATSDHFFLFWWKGTPLGVRLDQSFPGPKTVLWRRLGLNCPEHLRGDYQQIVNTLKEALTIFQVDGSVEDAPGLVEVQFGF